MDDESVIISVEKALMIYYKEFRMEYIIRVSWDEESKTWMGFNDEIPLAFDADTIEDLMKKVQNAAPEIIELNHLEKAASFYYIAERRQEAVV